MPSCGLFHDFELTPEGNGSYLLRLALEGDADVKRLFEDCGLASRVDHLGLPVSSRYSTGMRLSGVVDYRRLSVFCNYSRSTIIVNLMPYIDHCFALGPYTLFDDSSPSHSEFGNLVNRAKYDRDPEATNDLSDRLQEFIDSHPILSSSTVIAAPPGAVSSPLNLPLHWAKVIANQSGYELITPMKTRETIPQKDIDNIDDERRCRSPYRRQHGREPFASGFKGPNAGRHHTLWWHSNRVSASLATGGCRASLRAICREGREVHSWRN